MEESGHGRCVPKHTCAELACLPYQKCETDADGFGQCVFLPD